MRVAFLDALAPRLAALPAQYLPAPDFEVLVPDESGNLPDGWQDAEAAVWWSRPIDAALLAQMPKLKFLQRVGWFKSLGDASYALERGIPVAATPYGPADRVAEHAFTLTLMLLRRVPEALDALKTGLNPDGLPSLEVASGLQNSVNWSRFRNPDTLKDKTVGILGFGEFGAAYARLLTPFGTRTLAYRRRGLSPEQEAYYGVESLPLDELLHQSDIVASFIPGIPEANKAVGVREFALMKEGAYFLNANRGSPVDEDALIAALREKLLAGAALDVYRTEPLPLDHPLRSVPELILTPHVGGGPGSWMDIFARIRGNLEKVKAGRGDLVNIPVKVGDFQPSSLT